MRHKQLQGSSVIGVHYESEMDNDGLGLCYYIDESEVLTPADEEYHVNKHDFQFSQMAPSSSQQQSKPTD